MRRASGYQHVPPEITETAAPEATVDQTVEELIEAYHPEATRVREENGRLREVGDGLDRDRRPVHAGSEPDRAVIRLAQSGGMGNPDDGLTIDLQTDEGCPRGDRRDEVVGPV